MYYEEKVIDGKLMCRDEPEGEWQEVEYESLLNKYNHKKDTIQKLYQKQGELLEKLEKLEELAMDVRNDPLFV